MKKRQDVLQILVHNIKERAPHIQIIFNVFVIVFLFLTNRRKTLCVNKIINGIASL